MTDPTTSEPVLLDPGVDQFPEYVDHPDRLTEAEEERGRALYQTLADLDDDDNGLDGPRPTVSAPGPVGAGRSTAMDRARALRKVLLAHGVPEVSIELQEGRPTYGADPWNACQPVASLSHHMASIPTEANPTPGLWLVKQGRSDLPGPLANGTAGLDLVYRILCMGYANHPGYGGPWTVSGPLGAYTIPKDVARPYAWGTEFEGGYSEAVWDREYVNRRTGKRMTFREFMGRVNAGLVEGIWRINGHGKTPTPGMDLSGYHGEHKTWAPGRKPDRLGYETADGRKEIRKYAHQEDDVTAADVWEHKINVIGSDENLSAQHMLQQAHNRAAGARANGAAAVKVAKAAHTQATRNRDAIRALGDKLEEVTPGVAQAVLDALGDKINVEVSIDLLDTGEDEVTA